MLETTQLSNEAEAEIVRFAEEIRKLESGALDPDDFKRFRLENGVYGIRGTTDRHMVRIKILLGKLTPDQLETIADLVEEFTPSGLAHITTRQDIQLHNVARAQVPALLRRIAECGLTTREACGNTVRNVTACPYAGVSRSEPFDVTPYAEAVGRYFLRNPINQNMPRKFKIAFEGCTIDHALTSIHDIGAVARVRNGERGFAIYIAGGLGAQPRSADLLEDFAPADLLIPTAEAVIRVFDRHGERRAERTHRARARMKFLARNWGFSRLQAAILAERKAVLATRSGLAQSRIEAAEETVPELQQSNADPFVAVYSGPQFSRWRTTNVLAQKQAGWNTVTVRCPLGDLDAKSLRRVAAIARKYCGGRIRTAITQNILLRWVPDAALSHVFAELSQAGLAYNDADQLADITRCPGADTCQLALTHSRGLASALSDIFVTEFAQTPEVQQVSVKISGCMNSCGQHHIADIGFHGASENADGRELPMYILMLGGRTQIGLAQFGKVAGKIPARLVPESVRRMLNFYVAERRGEERFSNFVDRVGIPRFKELLEPVMRVPDYEREPQLFFDLGADGKEFKAEIGVGECAG